MKHWKKLKEIASKTFTKKEDDMQETFSLSPVVARAQKMSKSAVSLGDVWEVMSEDEKQSFVASVKKSLTDPESFWSQKLPQLARLSVERTTIEPKNRTIDSEKLNRLVMERLRAERLPITAFEQVAHEFMEEHDVKEVVLAGTERPLLDKKSATNSRLILSGGKIFGENLNRLVMERLRAERLPITYYERVAHEFMEEHEIKEVV